MKVAHMKLLSLIVSRIADDIGSCKLLFPFLCGGGHEMLNTTTTLHTLL